MTSTNAFNDSCKSISKRAWDTRFISLLLALFVSSPAFAADEETGDPDAVGHSADGYYLSIPFGMVELPRLLLVQGEEGGLRFDAFGSTHSLLESGKYHLLTAKYGEPFSEAAVEEFFHDSHHPYLYFPIEPVNGHILVDFSITRQILFVFVSALVLLIIGLRLAGRYKRGIGRDEAPHGTWQNMLEVIIAFIRDDVAKSAIGPKYKKYVPYLLTLFFFILLGNLIGLIPWGVTATSNIMVTGSLALLTFIITQVSGSKDYWRHIFWPPGVAVPIKFILIPVEFIGLFTKPLALAFRLFGNMMSGHLAIVSILGLIFITSASINALVGSVFVVFSIALTIFIYMLKIFVSFVQAYIFVMLTAVFIGLAAAEHHHEDHVHESDGEHHPVSHSLPQHDSEKLAAAGSGNGSMIPEPSLAKI